MDLSQTKIYPFIKDNPILCKSHHYDEGEFISYAIVDDAICWYVLEGCIEVYASSYNGKRIYVDRIREDSFAGKVGSLWGQNYFCDEIAATPCELLRLPLATIETLLRENTELERFFLMKCASRSYGMYKHLLSGRLFTQRQLLAAYIVMNAQGSFLYIRDMHEACNTVNTSTRNFYNLVYSFEEKGFISYKKPKTIFILNEDGLRRIGRPVLDFIDNRY